MRRAWIFSLYFRIFAIYGNRLKTKANATAKIEVSPLIFWTLFWRMIFYMIFYMNLATLDDVTKKRPCIGIYTRTPAYHKWAPTPFILWFDFVESKKQGSLRKKSICHNTTSPTIDICYRFLLLQSIFKSTVDLTKILVCQSTLQNRNHIDYLLYHLGTVYLNLCSSKFYFCLATSE